MPSKVTSVAFFKEEKAMMKINEMLLVIYNRKGTEVNALMNVEDFIKFAGIRQMESKMEIAKTMAELGRTIGNSSWSDIYFAANKTLYARYCTDERQLEAFLQGEFNDDPHHRFDGEISTWDCMKTLEVIGLGTEGGRAKMTYDYEKQENKFLVGSILHNFNNRDYRILKKYSDKNLLLQDIDNGAMVVGVDVGTFKRTLRYGVPSEENAIIGIEWGHGVYLPGQLSLIDFRALRQEYGTPTEIKDIQDYRQVCNEKFKMYFRLSKDDVMPDSIKEAATNAMYEEFGTGRPDSFESRLKDGCYDSNFIPAMQKERSR